MQRGALARWVAHGAWTWHRIWWGWGLQSTMEMKMANWYIYENACWWHKTKFFNFLFSYGCVETLRNKQEEKKHTWCLKKLVFSFVFPSFCTLQTKLLSLFHLPLSLVYVCFQSSSSSWFSLLLLKTLSFSVFSVFSVIYFFNYLFKILTDKSKLLYFYFIYLSKTVCFFYIFILKLANQV